MVNDAKGCDARPCKGWKVSSGKHGPLLLRLFDDQGAGEGGEGTAGEQQMAVASMARAPPTARRQQQATHPVGTQPWFAPPAIQPWHVAGGSDASKGCAACCVRAAGTC